MLCRRVFRTSKVLDIGIRTLAFYPKWGNDKLLRDNVYPEKNLVEKLLAEADENYAAFVQENFYWRYSPLRYQHRHVMKTIKQPSVKEFIDKLEYDLRMQLNFINSEANEKRDLVRSYPKSSLDLDAFSFVRDEIQRKDLLQNESPGMMESKDNGDGLMGSGQLTNQFDKRSLKDLRGLMRNYGILGGGSEFLKKRGGQAFRSLRARYRQQYNKVLAANTDDAISGLFSFKRNRELAERLQERYLHHLELSANREWDVLLDIIHSSLIKEIIKKTQHFTDEEMQTLFYFELLKNNSSPKIVSFHVVAGQDGSYLQILVKLDMRVRCLGPPNEEGDCTIEEMDKITYLVYEKSYSDPKDSFLLIGKVPASEVEYYKNNKYDLAEETSKIS